MDKITLKILKSTKRYPVVGQEIRTEVDADGVIIDRFLRRRLADAEFEEFPVLEVVTKKQPKKVEIKESIKEIKED